MKSKVIFVACILSLFFVTESLAATFAVIVSKSNPVSSMSKSEIKSIYLGKTGRWPDGNKIVLYSLYDQEITGAFTSSVMNKSAQQFATFWKKALFTGTGRPPMEMKSPAEIKKFIAADPRGIGYIPASAADDSVKVISVH